MTLSQTYQEHKTAFWVIVGILAAIALIALIKKYRKHPKNTIERKFRKMLDLWATTLFKVNE